MAQKNLLNGFRYQISYMTPATIILADPGGRTSVCAVDVWGWLWFFGTDRAVPSRRPLDKGESNPEKYHISHACGPGRAHLRVRRGRLENVGFRHGQSRALPTPIRICSASVSPLPGFI